MRGAGAIAARVRLPALLGRRANRFMGRRDGGVFSRVSWVPPGFPGFLPGSPGFRPGSSGVPFLGELLCFQRLLGFVWEKSLFPEITYSLCRPARRSGDSRNAFFRADLAEGLGSYWWSKRDLARLWPVASPRCFETPALLSPIPYRPFTATG